MNNFDMSPLNGAENPAELVEVMSNIISEFSGGFTSIRVSVQAISDHKDQQRLRDALWINDVATFLSPSVDDNGREALYMHAHRFKEFDYAQAKSDLDRYKDGGELPSYPKEYMQ